MIGWTMILSSVAKGCQYLLIIHEQIKSVHIKIRFDITLCNEVDSWRHGIVEHRSKHAGLFWHI